MAEEHTSGAKHITSLDFDTSAIPQQFKELETMVQDATKRLQSIFDENLKLKITDLPDPTPQVEDIKKKYTDVLRDMTQESPQIELNISGQSHQSLDELKQDLRDILAEKGKIASIKMMEGEEGELARATVTTITDQNQQIVETYKLTKEAIGDVVDGVQEYGNVWSRVGGTISENFRAQERRFETFSSSIEKAEKKLDGIKANMAGTINIGSNKYINEQIAGYQKELEILQKQIIEKGKIERADRRSLNTLNQQIDVLNNIATATKNTGINQLIDRTMWAVSFKARQGVLNVVREMPERYKQVEMSMVEITRVMNESTLDQTKYMYQLYDTAIAYGRAMEDVTEVTLRFAQAGYNSSDAMKLTQTTMLALNTAELEVNQATNSLIGIMQQWGYTADEYEGIIDRINITADSYAITSQDLVDALLQSSAVAKTAGVNFEDLIGVLTTMKVASGQSGKAVGTAFRSILSLMQRASSLKGFEALGIDVYADKATGTLLPMMDILQNMANVWNSSSKQMQNDFMNVADSMGFMSEEMAVNEEALSEYTEYMNAYAVASNRANDEQSRQQATLAANMHRRNYYIALMENFANIQDVVNNLQTADGYSMRENAKYMATLQAKTERFNSVLQETAVVLADSGYSDFAKLLLDVGTYMLNLLNQSKLTLPVFVSLGAVVITAINNFGVFKSAIKQAGVELSLFEQIERRATIGLQAFNLEMIAMTAGVTLVASTFVKLLAQLKEEDDYMKRAETNYQDRVKAIKEQEAAMQGQIGVAKVYVQHLENAMDATGKLSLSEQEAQYYVNALNNSIEGLNLKYDSQTKSLNMTTKAIYENIDALDEQLKFEAQKDYLSAKYKKQAELLAQRYEITEKITDAERKMMAGQRSMTAPGDLEKWNKQLEDIDKQYNEITAEIESDMKAFTDSTNIDTSGAVNGVNNLVNRLHGFDKSAEEAKESVESLVDVIVDLEDIYSQVLNGEALSGEQIFELLDKYPELATAIRRTADGWTIERSEIQKTIGLKYQLAAVDQAVIIAEQATAQAGYDDSKVLQQLVNDLSNTKNAAELAAIATRFLNSEMVQSGQASDGLVAAAQKMVVLGNLFQSVSTGNFTKGFGGNSGYSSGSGTSVYEQRIKELERLKKQIQDTAQAEIDALKKVEEERDRYRTMRDYQENLERAQSRSGVSAREEERDLLRKIKETQEDWDLEDRIAEIERTRDAQVRAIEAEISALRDKSTSTISGIGGYAYNTAVDVTDQILEEYGKMLNGELDGQKQKNEIIEEMAQENAINLRDYYFRYFVDPTQQRLNDMFAQAVSINGMLGSGASIGALAGINSLGVFGPNSGSPIGSTNSTINNNNLTMYSTISNQTDRSAVRNQILKRLNRLS